MANNVPQNVNDFYNFVKGIVEYVRDKLSTWTHIDDEDYGDLKAQFLDFEEIYKNMPRDPGRADINKRNTAQKELEKTVRRFIQENLRHHKITDDDLLKMTIKPIDRIRTQHTVVNEMVSFEIQIRRENELMIHFSQRGVNSKAKPTNYDGAVIIWTISEEEPASLDGYVKHSLASRTPYALKFDTHDSGKRVWIRIAWQNARGILGDYCEAKTAIVP